MKNKISSLAAKIYSEIVSLRHIIHQHPELAYNEVQTASLIARTLSESGIPYSQGHAGTGILGIIEGDHQPGHTVLLRADMDALQVTERSGVPFQSIHYGVMHACGHDMHTSCLLGAAKILQSLKKDLHGRILLLFQPAEEKIPGGAKLIIDEDVFEHFKPDYAIALHVDPELKTGTAGFRPGKYMASVDDIILRIKGKGGHAALPHLVSDTITAACTMVVELKKKILHATCPSVFAIGRIDAPGSTNIIPDEVVLTGTFRTLDDEWRSKAHRLIKEIANQVGALFNITVETVILEGYPSLENNPSLTDKAIQLAGDYIGHDKVLQVNYQMTAEDFAYFSRLFPSLMFRIGVTPTNITHPAPLHSSYFTADDRALLPGMGLLAYLSAQLTINT